jgi:hypothetical protein
MANASAAARLAARAERTASPDPRARSDRDAARRKRGLVLGARCGDTGIVHPGSTVVHAGLALGAVAAVLLGACSLEVDFDGSKFACSDGVCPSGFSCESDGWCRPDVPAGDAGAPDAADEPEPSPADAAPPDAADPCAGQAKVVSNGHCYGLFLTGATWAKARDNCAAAGGHLATVTSSAENQVVAGLLTGMVTDAWLAGNDMAVEDTFVWDNGETLSFTNWRIGEPNNGGANSVTGEDCIVIELDVGGTWDDRHCPQVYPYICESN